MIIFRKNIVDYVSIMYHILDGRQHATPNTFPRRLVPLNYVHLLLHGQEVVDNVRPIEHVFFQLMFLHIHVL